jgi:hypothetical protein
LAKLSLSGMRRLNNAVGERREAPRYPVDTRLFASLDGQTVRLDNISEQGVAIRGTGLSAGSAHLLELHIDRTHVALSIEILDCSSSDRLHARFVAPSADALQLIQAYIAAPR